jgi:hypothetical protein
MTLRNEKLWLLYRYNSVTYGAMVRFYQNRELSQKLGVNIAKWKRWSREFLPPDPLGGLQSGYARQYNLDDALTVYLGGYLVSELKFSIPEAKRILLDLKEWMRAHGFYYYYGHINGKDDAVITPPGLYRIHIVIARERDGKTACIHYRIKRVVAAEPAVLNGESVLAEKTVEEGAGDIPRSSGKTTAEDADGGLGSRVVYLTAFYRRFLEKLGIS